MTRAATVASERQAARGYENDALDWQRWSARYLRRCYESDDNDRRFLRRRQPLLGATPRAIGWQRTRRVEFHIPPPHLRDPLRGSALQHAVENEPRGPACRE